MATEAQPPFFPQHNLYFPESDIKLPGVFLFVFFFQNKLWACLRYSLWHRLYWPSVVISGRHLGFGQTRCGAQRDDFKFRALIRLLSQSVWTFVDHRLSIANRVICLYAGITSQHGFQYVWQCWRTPRSDACGWPPDPVTRTFVCAQRCTASSARAF